jgi:hypothetical protein
MLPDAITHGGGGDEQPSEFTVSQIIPEQKFRNATQSQLPMRTAAELGFDDSRYQEVPDDVRDLDPVGRQLMREERRAALEAQAHPQEQQQGYDGQQGGYDDGGQAAYQEQQAYDQQAAYGNQQQAYDEQYYAPNGDGQQGDGYAPQQGYPQAGYPEQQAPQGQGGYQGYGDQQQYQDEWGRQQGGYQNGYPAEYAPESGAPGSADVRGQDGVGFDRPGPAHSAGPALTDSGLPRRGGGAGGNGGGRRMGQEAPAPAEQNGDDSWRSSNDERWQSASKLRKPKAGGVTSSGLPKRVPRANLVEGTAESTPQGGPQVSRDPSDVRGRLSNLRRGVQRGRTAGNETNGQGFGPDSTYNQER